MGGCAAAGAAAAGAAVAATAVPGVTGCCDGVKLLCCGPALGGPLPPGGPPGAPAPDMMNDDGGFFWEGLPVLM